MATKKRSRKTKSKKSQTNKARLHQRADFPGRVYIHDEDSLYIAPLSNISVGGLFIKDVTNIPEGTEVKVVIKSPNLGISIQAIGDVVRVETSRSRSGLAVVFTDVSTDSKNVIQASVNNNSHDSNVESFGKAA